MAYVMLVAAVMTTALVTGVCFLFKWRRVYIVAPLQFIASFIVTYLVGPRLARDQYSDDAVVAALVISAAMPTLFIVMRLIVGRLDKPQVGGLVKHHHEHTDSTGA